MKWSCFCCSVAKLCPTFCNPMDCSTPGFSILHYLLEFAQSHVHWAGDAIQPSHPLSPPSLLTLNLSQHQGLFQWVGCSHQVARPPYKVQPEFRKRPPSSFVFWKDTPWADPEHWVLFQVSENSWREFWTRPDKQPFIPFHSPILSLPLGCVKPKPGTILAKSQSRIHSCALLVLRPNWEAVMKLAGRGYGDRHKQTTCPAGRLNREPQLIGPQVCLEALATPESSIVPATPVDALSPETGEWEGNQPGWRRHHDELQAWWESRAHGSVAQMGFEPLSWEF